MSTQFAVRDAYADVATLRARHGLPDGRHDEAYASALLAASAWVSSYTGRVFSRPTSVEARYFRARSAGVCRIDDLEIGATTPEVATSTTGRSGTFTVVDDVVLEPVHGSSVVDRLEADGVECFPTGRRCSIHRQRQSCCGCFQRLCRPRPRQHRSSGIETGDGRKGGFVQEIRQHRLF